MLRRPLPAELAEVAEVPPPLASPPPPPSSAPSSTALVARAIEGANRPEVHRGPSLPAIFFRGPFHGIANLPGASRLVVDCDWLRRPPRPSSGDRLAAGRASGATRPASRGCQP